MKTRELIRQLQELDPSGDVECCVGNVDIIYVQKLPAYYDGRLQVLKRDDRGGFNVRGVDFRRSGQKIDIATYSCHDGVSDDADFEVTGDVSDYYREQIEKWREDSRQFDRDQEERRASKLDAAPPCPQGSETHD